MNYNEIFTFENLYEAHLKARSGKRCKKDVILFENSLSLNLWQLYDELKDKSYSVTKYNKFYVYEPKKREIQAVPYKDRVVQHALCDLYLYPLLTKKFIYDNCACQKGKGTDFARNRLAVHLRSFYKEHKTDGYILKADIRRFFPSINHDVLKEMLEPIIEDDDILNFLYMLIDSYEGKNGCGIPMGNQTSQLFALYYLNPLDRLIKEKLRIKYYVRYMDDCILISESKEHLKEVLNQMTALVEDELLITFNNKTQIFPIKNGVDFLGFHFYMTDTGKVIKKLRKSSKKKFKNRMKKLQKQYENGEIEIEDINRVLPGYNGHLSRGHTYKLRKAVFSGFKLVRNNESIKSRECIYEEDK